MTHKQPFFFFTLFMLISFASVNAVLFTPALPDIANFFTISEEKAQLAITWFLVAYALGQLLYGPLSSRFGRKNSIYVGIAIQISGSLLCVLAGKTGFWSLFLLGRFLQAAGSGVGLKMTFTLVNECYAPQVASEKTSKLMLAFALAPGLAVALGGFLNEQIGWESCLYATALYGVLLLLLTATLPQTSVRDKQALQWKHLVSAYQHQFTNKLLVLNGLLMGCATTFVYVFAALAPFIAMTLAGMDSSQYGLYALLPSLGMITGSLHSAHLAKSCSLKTLMLSGFTLCFAGVWLLLIPTWLGLPTLISLFLPMMVIYHGLCFILANASTCALSNTSDKSHGSAIMSFMNMGLATLIVLCTGFLPLASLTLPLIFLLLCFVMFSLLWGIDKYVD